MKILSFLSAIFGLISFAFQMYEVFPRYQDSLEKISFVLLGVFIGSVFSYFNKNQVKVTKLNSAQSFIYLFFLILGLGFLVIVCAMIFTDDQTKTSTFQTVLFWMGLFTIGAMAALGSGLSVDHDTTNLDEKLMLARHYHTQGLFGKAIYFYQKALSSLEESDSRRNEIQTKLDAVKAEQVISQTNRLT